MKKIVVAITVILFVAVSLAYAEDRGTPAEAKAMLDKAVAFYKKNGPEIAVVALNNPKGLFVYKDLYVFAVDMKGKIIAHSIKPGLIGKGPREIRDADEVDFLDMMVAVAKTKGKGTVNYRWENPETLVVEKKTSYIEKVDGVILGCGYFEAYDWQRSAKPFESPQWWK
jgi:hypothetical protein